MKAFSQLEGPAYLILQTQRKIKEVFPEYVSLCNNLKSEGKLEIIEQTVGAPGLYHLTDVYVYPSRLDGIGLTTAEALACGLPVITSNNAPMNEFISEESGKLVNIARFYPKGDGYYWPQCVVDVEHLKACMQEFVDDSHKLVHYKTKARQSALKKWNWEQNSASVNQLFESSYLIPYEKKQILFQKAIAIDKKRRLKRKSIYYLKSTFPNICKFIKEKTKK